jgi:N-succinyldiaminopimelate aminotransferase
LNPLLERLQPYPFEKLRALLAGAAPNPALRPINLSIGEPKHPTPRLVKDALVASLDGLAAYPATAGLPELRKAIAGWLGRRYGIPAPDADTQVLPVNGTREALFAFAQTVLAPGARVVCPNPFYQIYEGAAILAGATPVYGEPADWSGVQLLYVCSPANPSGKVIGIEDWKRIFDLSDRHGFVIASDECYSEIYFDRPFERPGHALRLRRGQRRAAEEIPAVPHLPRLGDEPVGAARLDRRMERRGARPREPPALRAEVRRRPALAAGILEGRAAGWRVLSLVEHADRRRRVRAPPAA